MEMVELSLIEDAADNRELKSLVSRHFQYTNSPLAKRILDDWSHSVEQFIKVIPIEYKKILHEEKMAQLNQKLETVERDY